MCQHALVGATRLEVVTRRDSGRFAPLGNALEISVAHLLVLHQFNGA